MSSRMAVVLPTPSTPVMMFTGIGGISSFGATLREEEQRQQYRRCLCARRRPLWLRRCVSPCQPLTTPVVRLTRVSPCQSGDGRTSKDGRTARAIVSLFDYHDKGLLNQMVLSAVSE